ncbi:mannose-1-phosphate guanylyltransferase/mannose-6-phosphate isomerase [Hydrogenophaga sp.]|uniref:mannose-1-phosphate guanylyltransferase/mannose-6-phosphate isomerase n=1 Tax=Hydrogenophaga sp. TaxID=1904254 RepID=UPI003F6BF3ED
MTPMPPICPVILAGGSGTRLWPLSRAGFPKQFLCLDGAHSLFQQTAMRLSGLRSEGLALQAPLVVGNEDHRFLVLEQLREVSTEAATLLLEPMGRNTAPALALAALAATAQGQDPVLVVTPADHVITDEAAFRSAVTTAVAQAAQGQIVILGVTPTRPETGYGYIQVQGGPAQAASPVLRFVEKPDAATAQRYLEEGGYLWNAGMFVVKASVWLQALERFRPDMVQASQIAWAARSTDASFVRPGKAEFAAIPADSIDYAVMERCPGSGLPIQVVPLNAGWSDLGAWDAVWDALPKDALGNATQGDVLAVDSRNNLVHASSRLVGVVGVNDLVVVETPDAVLVAHRASAQGVKQIVALLQAQHREEHNLHRKVHRPWGWYDSIDESERFKVKRIQVKPKASLSLQKHYHRAEHWIVVKGTAEITCGDKVLMLTENQSTYIPLGEVHRLSNPGTIPLEIIEVQSGSYLGEDDIVRFEDRYGR